jgi:hypothetical protein
MYQLDRLLLSIAFLFGIANAIATLAKSKDNLTTFFGIFWLGYWIVIGYRIWFVLQIIK